ncbi:MAG: hypothetical protein QOI83_3107, partial [Streptomycetaceae bacterium]|nr:hypothetical protein [Streptomycetaceae bacterium]
MWFDCQDQRETQPDRAYNSIGVSPRTSNERENMVAV